MQAEPRIITFGCRLNAYESEVMRGHAQAAGLQDTIIFNTCAVTAEAERQARQAIRRARRRHPAARIIVTGCAAQINPGRFAAMPEVLRIVGNAAKLTREAWMEQGPAENPPAENRPAENLPAENLIEDIMEVRETAGHPVTGFEGLARAFVQAQTGCDHRCTFCVIPYGRGPSRSVPIGQIVAQTRALVGRGYCEIVLTGVDIASFGGDLPGRPRLGSMIRRLLALVPELPRLRLSSLDPAAIDDDLWRLIASEPRLMPHLHLSLQSGDDMILKRMKRRHGRAQALEICRRARSLRPDIALGADFIAGFPTESNDMARATEDFVSEAGLTFLHVFPYSRRPGTPAARMPEVPGPVVKQRAAALRALGEQRLNLFLHSRIGRPEQVLVEAPGIGRTAHYAETTLGMRHEVGAVVPFLPRAVDGKRLTGDD